MIEYISAGDTVPIAVRLMTNGAGASNVSPPPTVRIQRYSDGLWLDISTNTFGAYDPFTAYQDLAPVTDDLSRYLYVWNTGAIVNPVAGDTYFATIDVTTPSAYSVTAEISTALIPAVRAGLALASALATVQSGINALTSGLSTISGIVTTVRKRLTNRAELDSSGTLRRYDDDATTVIATSTIRDYQGNAITLSAGEPARTSAES